MYSTVNGSTLAYEQAPGQRGEQTSAKRKTKNGFTGNLSAGELHSTQHKVSFINTYVCRKEMLGDQKEDEKCANQSRTLGVALARQPHFPLCLSMCDSCSSGQRSLFLDSHHQAFIWSTRINLKISALARQLVSVLLFSNHVFVFLTRILFGTTSV